MREKVQEGIEYFGSWYAELFGDKRRKSEELGFTYMLTADIQEQAMKEAINRTLKGLTEEIEKVEYPIRNIEGVPKLDTQLFNTGFMEAKQKILSLLKE